jgi:ATP-dependent helicase YprA (DUF1998 family)
MPINPVQFAHSICDEFLRYIFSEFPLSDPQMEAQARALLKGPTSLDMPLVKGPFVSLSEAFAKGESIQQMADDGLLHPVMPALIGYPTMYLHQQEVLEAVRRKRHVLVSTGTGSGKTEAFLYPIVDQLLRERDQGITSGLSAILVYPMNALANDQLDRLRKMLGGTGVTFGQWVGPTPDTEARVTIDRFDSSSREAYLAAREQRLVEAQKDDRAVRPLAPTEECCSEEAIRNRKPRILVTNYRQLEILTTRLPDVELFSGAPLKFLVFDEAHSYTGAVGAEVACLIRRLRMLANKEPEDVICIGTSATLSDPSDPQSASEKIAGRFVSRFFGVDSKDVAVVGESYVERDWPTSRYKPVFPHGDGMERLSRILDAVTEPVKHDVVKSVVEELTGQIFEPSADWRKSLFAHLIGNEYVYQTTEILKQPKRLSEAAWQTSQRLALGRKKEGNDCSAELLCYLVLGAAARNGDESLLRPKVHFFLRGLDEMVVALGSRYNPKTEDATSSPTLYLSLANAKEAEGGGRKDDSYLPVLTCRNCGQHFFEQHFEGLEIAYKKSGRLEPFGNGNAVTDDSGRENAVWSTAPAETGTRLLMTNRLLEDAADNSTGRANRWPTVFVCYQCGALHRDRSNGCLADGCGHGQPLVPLLAFGDEISSCPSCSSRTLQIGGRRIEPAKPIRAVTVADVHNLSQAMINAAPEGHKKLIVFADSRQDAAFQAGWMQDHARRIRMRHMMYQVLESQSGPVELDAIVDGLMDIFRKDSSLIESLLPELQSEEAPVFFGHNKWVPVYKSLRYMVLREFTTSVRSTRWLEALGLSQVHYAGLTAERESVIQWANLIGVTPTEAVDLISLILDGWRRNRMVHIANDPVYSQYHRKDDPFIQLGLLALSDFHPGGLDLYKPEARSSVKTGLIADNGATAIQVLLRRVAAQPDILDIDAAISSLWDILKDDLKIVRKVGFQDTREQIIGEAFQLAHEKILVGIYCQKERCTTCQRVTTRKCPTSACVRYRCPGSTVTEPSDSENYDVWLMGKPFTMISAEEHTAQVPGDTRTFIEQDFKSRNGRTNCLVATPTLEMGVNIGSLDMTLMRNVPPLASNYWQRAGRAGREERMAVIMTYCRRSLHDRYFFEEPLRILDGAIEAPSFNLKNPLMVAKHIRSAVLSILLLKSRLDGELSDRIRLVLKHLFPHFIRDYLLDNENRFRSGPLSTNPLRMLLAELPNLRVQIASLLTKNWPSEAADLASEQFVGGVLADMPNDLTVVLTRLHNRLTWARNTRKELHRKKDEGIIEREEEQLLWRCDDYIRSVVKREAATYSLSVLGTEGFFPGYGVNDGGVVASARKGFAKGSGKYSFDLNRGNVIALREFVPGNRLYANRGSFYVSRYHLGTDEASKVRTLYVNAQQRYIAEKNEDQSYGQSGSVAIDTLPITDSDLSTAGRITDEELLRFSMPVSILGRLRRINRGGKAIRIGDYELSYLRGQGIELVNLGEAGRVNRGELGHWICSVCGATKTPYAVPAELQHFLTMHQDGCGKAPTPLALRVNAEVDCLQFHNLADEKDAINIGEALVAGAANVLEMGDRDLESLVVHKPDGTVDLLIFDPMPGGSGLLDQMLERWDELIVATKALLSDCPQSCDQACYMCLLTFRNQFNHSRIDRHRALELVFGLQHKPDVYRVIAELHEETIVEDTGKPTNTGEARFVRLLRDHHFPEGQCNADITTSAGLTTRPDWLHEQNKVAVYLDGMSKSLHGDPKRAQRDQLIRQMMELDGYKVIVIQSRDLNDPQIVRTHLRNLADAINRTDLAEMIRTAPLDFELSGGNVNNVDDALQSPKAASSDSLELLEFADPICHDFLNAWIQKNLPLPVVGYDLIDEEGIIVAESELAWPTSKIAAAFPDSHVTEAFKAAGWSVYDVNELMQALDEIVAKIGDEK